MPLPTKYVLSTIETFEMRCAFMNSYLNVDQKYQKLNFGFLDLHNEIGLFQTFDFWFFWCSLKWYLRLYLVWKLLIVVETYLFGMGKVALLHNQTLIWKILKKVWKCVFPPTQAWQNVRVKSKCQTCNFDRR